MRYTLLILAILIGNLTFAGAPPPEPCDYTWYEATLEACRDALASERSRECPDCICEVEPCQCDPCPVPLPCPDCPECPELVAPTVEKPKQFPGGEWELYGMYADATEASRQLYGVGFRGWKYIGAEAQYTQIDRWDEELCEWHEDDSYNLFGTLTLPITFGDSRVQLLPFFGYGVVDLSEANEETGIAGLGLRFGRMTFRAATQDDEWHAGMGVVW